jgi:hypothetical protein
MECPPPRIDERVMVNILSHFDSEMEAHRNALILGIAPLVDATLGACQQNTITP